MKYYVKDIYGNSWGNYKILKAIYSWIVLSISYKDKDYYPHWKIYKMK